MDTAMEDYRGDCDYRGGAGGGGEGILRVGKVGAA
jgi:hypothetical protein